MCIITKDNPKNTPQSTIDYLLSPLECSQILYLDSKYYCPTANEAIEAIKYSLKNIPQYESDIFDCDDFAFRAKYLIANKLKINSMGVVLGYTHEGYHAWNLILTKDEELIELTFFEPQTGELWAIGDPLSMSFLPDIVII